MSSGKVAMKAWVAVMAWLVAGEVKKRTDAGMGYTLLDKIHGNDIDRREYRLLRLNNQIEVLIGRDGQYDKSIVVLDVRAGFRQEAPKRCGVMHLYEHILNTNEFKAVSDDVCC
ncbi:metalloprotease [Entomophthora muscae]|uniref:Metalloprotease n=1 Tax=Entomophthora muscae TaxID=34485 RepID=A0ACC2RRC5_9FUNG|nr:metalloprotease [Entomophthora muscae]